MKTTTPEPPRRPPASPPEPRVLRDHEAGVQALAFSGDGEGQQRLLVSGDADGIVKLWDLASCRPRLSFPTPTGPPPTAGAAPLQGVLSLHPFQGGRQLLTQQRGGLVMAWDLGEGGDARPVGNPIVTGAYHFCKASFPCTGTGKGSVLLLAPSADSGAFGLWDMRVAAGGTSRPVLTFGPPPAEAGTTSSLAAMAGGGGGRGLCMALQLLLEEQDGDNGDGSAIGAATAATWGYAIAAYEDGSLHMFDLRAGRVACGAKLLQETVLSLDVGPSRARGVLGSAGSELVVFGLDLAQHRLYEETRLTLPRPGAADIKIRPDEKLFAVGGWDHRVRAFSLGTKQKRAKCTPLAVLQCHAESVQALAFAGSGGMLLASGGKDARIALWDLYPPES